MIEASSPVVLVLNRAGEGAVLSHRLRWSVAWQRLRPYRGAPGSQPSAISRQL